MLKTFARKVSRKFDNVVKLFYTDDVDDGLLESEKNLYKRGIIRYARAIENFVNEECTSAFLAEAVDRIGRLAYAGGPPATKCAGSHLQDLGRLLTNYEAKTDAKIAIMKTISIITVGHLEHQDCCESLGILNDVMTILEHHATSEAMQLWACYCLHNMAVGNISCMETIANRPAINETLADVAKLDWNSFVRNYADQIIKLIGLDNANPNVLRYDSYIENRPLIEVPSSLESSEIL